MPLRSAAALSRVRVQAIEIERAQLASWIAAMPTPPAPAWMSTVSPAVR